MKKCANNTMYTETKKVLHIEVISFLKTSGRACTRGRGPHTHKTVRISTLYLEQ